MRALSSAATPEKQLYPFDLTSRTEREIISANAEPDSGGPILHAYLAELIDDENFDEPSVVAAGRCPICHRVHAYGIASGSMRWTKCRGVDDTPDRIQVRFVQAPMPDDIAREYDPEADRRDLMTFAMLARSHAPWTPLRTRIALRAVVRSEVLDERIAVAVEDGGLSIKQARRDTLAVFIRRQPGRTMRARLAGAIFAAYDAAGRGDIDL